MKAATIAQPKSAKAPIRRSRSPGPTRDAWATWLAHLAQQPDWTRDQARSLAAALAPTAFEPTAFELTDLTTAPSPNPSPQQFPASPALDTVPVQRPTEQMGTPAAPEAEVAETPAAIAYPSWLQLPDAVATEPSEATSPPVPSPESAQVASAAPLSETVNAAAASSADVEWPPWLMEPPDIAAANSPTETFEEPTGEAIAAPTTEAVPVPETEATPESVAAELAEPESERAGPVADEAAIAPSESTTAAVGDSPVTPVEPMAIAPAVETPELTEEDPLPEAPGWFQHKAQAAASAATPPDAPADKNLGTPQALPYRAQLEARLGQSLGHIQVYGGESVQVWLGHHQARAATVGDRIFFAEPQPDLAIVTHEVIHVLQGESATTPPVAPVSESATAEQEAQALTATLVPELQQAAIPAAPWQPIAVRSRLAPTDIAYLREAPPATVSPAAPPDETFAATVGARSPPVRGPPAPETVTETEAEPSPDQAAAEASLAADEAALPEGDLETVPALEPPAPPEPGITEADVAAREAALAAAEAALANAADVDEKVDAFADAPPTIKARQSATLNADLSDLAQSESEDFQADAPEFSATLSGEVEEVPELQVESPTGEAGDLEAAPPPPAPEPEVAPTPAAEPYPGNRDLSRVVSRFTEGTSPQDRATDIGNTLEDVQTTDPDVDTSPGPPPAVPLEGETDPQRIADQLETGTDRATTARDDAQQAVINGPGPERVQPQVMDEPCPLEALNSPELTEAAPVEGVDEFTQREMPPEVNTAFDLENQDAMAASLGEAKTQMRQTTEERDRGRQAAVDEAETQAEETTRQADQDQRDRVQEQRQRIQDERQGTLEAQNDAVREVENDAETRRRDDRDAIDDRVREDQATIRTDYSRGEREAEGKVREGERQAEDKRQEAERDAENESWWDRAVNFVQRAFEALTSAIGAIFDAVREAVNKLLDEIKAAALALIDLAADFIKDAIAAFGEFLKGLVDGLLGDLFPGLAAALNDFIDGAVELAQQAVDAVANELKAGINAIVEGLRAGLNAVLDALQAGLEFVSTLVQAALAGDWGAVIRLLLEAVLKVIGIEPETFYAFIGRAQDTFQKILDDPGAVVSNLLDAVKLGIQQFADNFLTHLQTGIIGWLTGALGDIQIPSEFNLVGLLDLARQILGLTIDFVRRIAVRLIGEENVERIESLLGYVQTLITDGWGALFEQIMQDLAGLKDMVIEQIKEFLVTRLILAAITKLASLFNPIGAIVQLLLTAWNIYTFLRDNLQRMIQIVQSIVEGIANIVNGVLAPAANRIEETLANLLPIAISFLMSLLGISGVAARVRRIIGRLRERIENAIVNFIRRIGDRFTGRGRQREPEQSTQQEEQIAATGESLGERLPVPVSAQETHHLYITVQGQDATLMVQSTPRTVDALYRSWTQEIVNLTSEADQQTARTLLQRLDTGEDRAEQTVEASLSRPDQNQSVGIGSAARGLVDILIQLFRIFGATEDTQATAQILQTYNFEIDIAHPSAQRGLIAELTRDGNASRYLEMGSWTRVKADLKANNEFIQKPLLANHPFGQAIRQVLDPEVQPAFEELQAQQTDPNIPNNVARFISARVGQIHAQQPPFNNSLEALQDLLFDASRRQGQQIVRYELIESMESYASTEGVNAELQAAVSTAGGIVEFLQAMAVGQTVNGINHQRLHELWGQTVNREWLKTRFRAATPGSHEWIPTNMIPAVIDRARSAGNAEEAAKWIGVHHHLRTDTSWVIFKPAYSQKQTTENGTTYVVMQGHPGALYLQEGSSLVPQTQKSGEWHNTLRDHFSSNETVRSVIEALKGYFNQTVWHSGLPNNVYPQHRNSAGEIIDMQARSGIQSDRFERMASMFDDVKQRFG